MGRPSYEDIVAFAEENNQRLGVTGFIASLSEKFVQYIEGEKETLNNLMSSIKKDERHKIEYIYWFDARADRRFSDWNMRKIDSISDREISLHKSVEATLKMLSGPYSDPDLYERCLSLLVERVKIQRYR